MWSNKIKWDYGCSCQFQSQRNRGRKGEWTGKQNIYMEINHALTDKRFACSLEIVSSIFRTSIPCCLESKQVMWTEKTTSRGAQRELGLKNWNHFLNLTEHCSWLSSSTAKRQGTTFIKQMWGSMALYFAMWLFWTKWWEKTAWELPFGT